VNQDVTIELLNHASIIVRHGTASLLCDPWFDGTCFRDGWGLRYFNPGALEKAIACSHLWISHFHSDHLHIPTLRRVAQHAPEICTLANVSANFDMKEPLKGAGFINIHPFYERRTLSLKENYAVTRYSTTGIDNMLVVSAGGLTILNFNDCNIPLRAIRSLVRKIGRIDILLVNYNHAQKLLDYPSHELVKETLKNRFHLVVQAVNPGWVIPFASHHYYRSPGSVHQNGSLLTVEELATVVPSTITLAVGDRAIFVSAREPVIERLTLPLPCAAFEEKRHEASVPWDRLVAAAEDYRQRLRHGFLGFIRWLPPLAIRADDLDRVLILDVVKKVSERRLSDGPVHISAHSQSLVDWLGKPFGASVFWVGGDLAIHTRDTRPIQLMMLAGLLLENRLALRDVVRMLVTPQGWRFFLNRREEIIWTLLGRRFRAGDSRIEDRIVYPRNVDGV
jgi:L-ascorbate metabolism protein UlaG (beta-lactamase superfamily)